MFDDPKKALQQLQDKLLAAEEAEREPPEVDEDTVLAEVEAILAGEDSFDDPEPEDTEDIEDIPQKATHFLPLLISLILETLVLVGLVAWWLLWR